MKSSASAEKQRGVGPCFSHACGACARGVFLFLTILLIVGGVLYRIASGRLGLIAQTPVKMAAPLSIFPYELGDWIGEDVSLSESVLHAARNDDFLNRAYKNNKTNEYANVYVAFTARPRTMVGHKPTVCYPAGGWVNDSTEKTSIVSGSGRFIPSLLHRFHRPGPDSGELVVLNFYIVNGELTNDESVFDSVFWRTPNIHGDPARYVAQVQISSVSESSVRVISRDIADLLIALFPGKTDSWEKKS
jgi:hypothetical protein